MKKIILFLLFCFIGGVVKVNAQDVKKMCGNENNAAWQQAISLDPTLVLRRQQAVVQMEQYLKDVAAARTADTLIDVDSVLIIPTVFHILQEGNSENIADSWVNDPTSGCVAITNKDYARRNADTTETPAAFKPVAANTKIEYRLATIDPYGNCTNGIDRVYTHRTVNFTDYGKAVIDWPSNKYLNIWVVASISSGGFAGTPGEIIGYAQFPVSGPSNTDGVVLRYDYVGNFAGNNYAGRDADHEIGHYLNMIHIWGDADCGNDDCADTPTQEAPDYGCVPYPHITCGNNGDMSDNYMDYSDGSCKNIFTRDQKARMRATMYTARVSLWQQSNLQATGTADPYIYPNTACAPKADFLPIHRSVCLGSSVLFGANNTNGTATSWNWSFPGGTPSSSTGPNPSVTYSNPGVYNVTLTTGNATGSSTITRDSVVFVDYSTGQNTLPFTDGFEDTLSDDWKDYIFLNDDGGPGWHRSNRAAHSGSYSMSIQNYETTANTAPNSVKEFETPSFDFSNIISPASPVLSFWLSYGQQSSANGDSLSIGASINCGVGFNELLHLTSDAPNSATATNLAAGNGGFQPVDFVPTHDQWRLIQIQLKPSTYDGKSNVKFRFQLTTGILSNNIYIDDISIAQGTVGINEEGSNSFTLNADPNPSSESFTVSYTLMNAEDLTINMYDLQGRLVRPIESKHASPGSYQIVVDAKSFYLASGIYILKMTTTDGVLSKRIVYSNN